MANPLPRNLVLAILSILLMAGCGDEPADVAGQTTDTATGDSSLPDDDVEEQLWSDDAPCAQDGLCNTSSECGGLPKQGDNIDPDCQACDCSFYPGICEVAEMTEPLTTNTYEEPTGCGTITEYTWPDTSPVPCPCDWDCRHGEEACGQDGFCDMWCKGFDDPDCFCRCCTCDYYRDVCEAGSKCSTSACPCDMDCADGMSPSCTADGCCDSWCPIGVDPDCADFPDKDGKYCQ